MKTIRSNEFSRHLLDKDEVESQHDDEEKSEHSDESSALISDKDLLRT